MVTLRLLAIGFFYLLAGSALAQRSSYISYSTSDGLAQSQVRAIVQDHQGYLWLGTLGGLSRFDGFEFVNYSRNDGLPDNQINALIRDRNRVYIGSTGAVCFVEDGGIHSITFPEGFENARVMSLAVEENGALWLGLDGKGLLRWHEDSFTLFTEKEGLPDGYIRSLATDADNSIWVGTRSGVVVVRNGKITGAPHDALSTLSISDIQITNNQEVLVATFNAGVFHFAGKSWNHLTTDNGLVSNDIRCIETFPDGRIWLGSAVGLSLLYQGQLSSYSDRDGMPYANVKSLGADNEGHLWIGTDGKGLMRKAGTAFTTFTTREGLFSDIALGMAAAPSGSIYLGSYDQGLQVYSHGKLMPYDLNESLPNKTVWQVAFDSTGNLWAGTSMGLFSAQNGRARTYGAGDGLPGNRITALAFHQGDLWVGAELGMAVVGLDGAIKRVYNEGLGFEGKRIRSIASTDDGLWIAAQGQVIHLSEKGSVSAYPVDARRETAVYCLAHDANGYLWAGTADGLFVHHPGGEELTQVEFSNNFSARNVNFITILADATLLLGTNNGLYRLGLGAYYDRNEVNIKHYTAFEGLVGNETNQNAVLVHGDEVWFGTTQGAVRFTPYDDPLGKGMAPAILISDVELFQRSLQWNSAEEQASAAAPELKHFQNNLTFHFAGIYLTNPGKVRYRYRLVGADIDWLGPTRGRTATYAYLPHGNYTFEVEAFAYDEPDNASLASISFSIRPPFYLTGWFFAVAAAALFGLVYLLVRFRVQKEREKRASLQLQYQSRMLVLETQSLNSSMNRHFIFNALNSIQYYINMQDRVAANRYLTSFARLIRKNLDSSQENQTRLKDELERVSLYLDLEEMRFQGRFTYEVRIDPSIDLEKVKVPAMMLQPFLENSIWHGILPSQSKGTIILEVKKANGRHDIIITDNGIGYDTSLRQKRNLTNGHVSKGMEITQSRIALFGKMTGLNYLVVGPLELKNEAGETVGTRVEIQLPFSSTLSERNFILENSEN